MHITLLTYSVIFLSAASHILQGTWFLEIDNITNCLWEVVRSIDGTIYKIGRHRPSQVDDTFRC